MVTRVVIPATAESVSEVILTEWLKGDGEWVETDEPICVLETDKADVELPSPASGVLKREKQEGETCKVGDSIGTIDESGEKSAQAAESPKKAEPESTQPEAVSETKPAQAEKPEEPVQQKPEPEEKPGKPEPMSAELSPAVQRLIYEYELNPSEIQGTGKGGRLTKEDVIQHIEKQHLKEETPQEAAESEPPQSVRSLREMDKQYTYALDHAPSVEEDKRMPMSKIRKRIADNLVKSQQTAAMLTTFNEIDMQEVLRLRIIPGAFEDVHGSKLGIMSFVRACILALKEFPH